jgi:hypothetical protein
MKSKAGKEFEIKEIIAKEGVIAGIKHRWNNLSKPKQIALTIFVLIYIIALAIGGASK